MDLLVDFISEELKPCHEKADLFAVICFDVAVVIFDAQVLPLFNLELRLVWKVFVPTLLGQSKAPALALRNVEGPLDWFWLGQLFVGRRAHWIPVTLSLILLLH